jgi:hypothetical protein
MKEKKLAAAYVMLTFSGLHPYQNDVNEEATPVETLKLVPERI